MKLLICLSDKRRCSSNFRIRPHKFRVVNQILRRHSPDFNYLPQLLQSVGPFVQYLTIESLSTAESLKLRAILSSCPNVRNLVIYPPSPVGRPSLNYLLPALQGMPHLTHLTAALLSVPYDKFLTLPFLNLTHLAILLPNGRSWEGEWKVLTHLPKLTHLSVEFFVQVDIILHLLLFCPLLKLLTVIPYHEMDPYELCGYRVDDNRFVQLVGLTYADRILDWERGANGGMDKWKFSELVIFARGSEYSSNSAGFRAERLDRKILLKAITNLDSEEP